MLMTERLRRPSRRTVTLVLLVSCVVEVAAFKLLTRPRSSSLEVLGLKVVNQAAAAVTPSKGKEPDDTVAGTAATEGTATVSDEVATGAERASVSQELTSSLPPPDPSTAPPPTTDPNASFRILDLDRVRSLVSVSVEAAQHRVAVIGRAPVVGQSASPTTMTKVLPTVTLSPDRGSAPSTSTITPDSARRTTTTTTEVSDERTTTTARTTTTERAPSTTRTVCSLRRRRRPPLQAPMTPQRRPG